MGKKQQLHRYFKQQTGEIELKKGNLKRETESLLIAAKNSSLGTNYIKAKIKEFGPQTMGIWAAKYGNLGCEIWEFGLRNMLIKLETKES